MKFLYNVNFIYSFTHTFSIMPSHNFNTFSQRAGEDIAEALQKNSTLQRLDVRMNNIAAREDEKIAEKLTLNRKLRRIKSMHPWKLLKRE